MDIIVDYAVLGKMRETYDAYKNDRLKKYEIKTGKFDIYIYPDHYCACVASLGDIVKDHAVKSGFKVSLSENGWS